MPDIDPELWVLVHGGPEESFALPDLPPGVVDWLVEWASSDIVDEDLAILVDEVVCPELLDRVAAAFPSMENTLEAVAYNPCMPEGTLERLRSSSLPQIRMVVARHRKRLPKGLRGRLYEDPDEMVRKTARFWGYDDE